MARQHKFQAWDNEDKTTLSYKLKNNIIAVEINDGSTARVVSISRNDARLFTKNINEELDEFDNGVVTK
jgi:hypothetical protein